MPKKRSLQIEEEKEAALLSQRLKVEALKAQREREIEEAKAAEAAAISAGKIAPSPSSRGRRNSQKTCHSTKGN